MKKGFFSLRKKGLSLYNFSEDEYLIDVYVATPKMSTYLVAFAIGDFDYMETAAGTTQVTVKQNIFFVS